MANKLAPLQDLVRWVGPVYESVSGTLTPVTTGTVTGFLATTNTSSATAADASLSATLTHVGGNADGLGGTHAQGTWEFVLDASALTLALLNTHFAATGVAYLIVKRDNAFRVWERLEYVTSLQAEIE